MSAHWTGSGAPDQAMPSGHRWERPASVLQPDEHFVPSLVMRTSPLAIAGALVALSLLFVPVAGQAQSDRERAATLVEQGTSLFDQGEFEEAAIVFQQAYNLDPHPVLMYNIARTHQEMGDLPAALEFFRNVLAFDPDEPVAEAARNRIRDVETALRQQGYDPLTVESGDYVPRGSLTIVTVPEGAGVSVDDGYIGVSPVDVPVLDAGEYTVHVTLDGYYPVTAVVEVRGGRDNLRTFALDARTSLDNYVPPQAGYLTVLTPEPGMTVSLDGQIRGTSPLEAVGVTPGRYAITVTGENYRSWTDSVVIVAGEETRVLAQMTRIPGTEDRSAERRQAAGNALMGAGSGLIVVGGVVGVLALDAASSYREDTASTERRDLRDAARTRALVADVAIGTGIAALGTGLVLRLTPGRSDRDGTPAFDQLVLSPSWLPDRSRGFAVGARF